MIDTRGKSAGEARETITLHILDQLKKDLVKGNKVRRYTAVDARMAVHPEDHWGKSLVGECYQEAQRRFEVYTSVRPY